MVKLTLAPVGGATPFTSYVERIRSPLFSVTQIPSSDSAIVINAVSIHDLIERLHQSILEQPEIETALSQGAALLLDCCTEGPAFHSPSWEAVHENLRKLGLSGNKVVYITNNHSFKGAYEKWAKGAGLGVVRVLPHNYFFRSVVNGMRPRIVNTAERKHIVGSIFPSSRPRQARFLCLNHRLRGHRIVALGRLVRIGAFDSGHVSVLGGDSDRSAVSLEKALSSAREMFPRFAEEIEAFKQLIDRIPIVIQCGASNAHSW